MNAVFALSGIVAVAATVMMITRRSAVHALLYFVVSLLASAVIMFVLGAAFVAALEVIVYAGAIMVLFVFVIMLLNAGAESKHGRSLVAQLLGAPLLIALLGLLAYFVERLYPRGVSVRFGGFTHGTPLDIGRALFTTYLLPFEATSILILIAIVGAIVLAWKEMD